MKRISAFEQTERIALKITKLLDGLTYQDIANILTTVERMAKENAVFEKIISDS
jgi:hypothetical protein